ncbi:MAG: hypothetical protein RBR86_04945 [Pseudobdellovibrionaceae bacterium]|jgi:hypothetical protein|nr:hypothetical protein [Pseudobdellovibrionaceae bacterium]
MTFAPPIEKNLVSPRAVSQQGSALIYVFIGVILFGILGITYTRSMQQKSGDVDDKTAKVGASEIISYAKTIDRAVNKMLINRVSEADLGFTNTVTTLNASGGTIYSGNPNCSVATCEIFDAAGGKVRPTLVGSSYIIDNYLLNGNDPMAGSIFPAKVIVEELGSAEPDLVISFYGLKMAVCKSINNSFNIDNPNDAPPVEDDIPAVDYYDGDLSTSTTTLGDTVADFEGKMDFCYKASGSDPALYIYQHVLIAR